MIYLKNDMNPSEQWYIFLRICFHEISDNRATESQKGKGIWISNGILAQQQSFFI